MNALYLKSLKNTALFRFCDLETLKNVLDENCTELTFESGSVIFEPSISDRSLGVILSGIAKVHPNDSEKEVLLRKLYAGDVFGVTNVLNESSEKISRITAKSKCKVLFIENEAVRYLLENDKNFMYAYIEFFANRIRFLNRKILFYTAGSAERRLAAYLLSFGTKEVTPDVPMNSLADLLDIGRASLYRAFDHLSGDGLIRREKDTIIITSKEELKKIYNI